MLDSCKILQKQSEAFIRFCGIFPSLKQNFIACRYSEVSSCPDCIFEIHLLWQSGFSRVYSNCCCSRSLEPEILKIGQSSHKMYSNNRLNFEETTTILNACTKNEETYWMNDYNNYSYSKNDHLYMNIYTFKHSFFHLLTFLRCSIVMVILYSSYLMAQSAGALEYTNCLCAETSDKRFRRLG